MNNETIEAESDTLKSENVRLKKENKDLIGRIMEMEKSLTLYALTLTTISNSLQIAHNQEQKA